MYLTNYGENAYAEKLRGTEPTFAANWYLAFGTAATDASFSEISHVSMPRLTYARSLANWAGTQGAGTTLASSGTSHVTSNNNDLTWAAPSTDLATALFVGLFDAVSAGNCWAYIPITSLPILNGVAPEILAGAMSFRFGNQGVSDYLSNKLIDEFFRAQSYAWPASIYGALYTAAPTDAGGGTEVGGGVGYARLEIDSDATSWDSTGGVISNDITFAYPAPTGTWGTVEAEGFKDASSGGNLLLWGAISPQSILASTPAPSHAPGTLQFPID